MGSKLKSEKKNNIGNHGEHSRWFDTKTVIPRNDKYCFMKECSGNLASPIIMKRSKKYTRKLPETTEELISGLQQRCPKRRKIENYQEEFIKENLIEPLIAEHQTMISETLKFKPESSKTKCSKTKHYKPSLEFLKLNPEVVLDFIKQPSVNKLMNLLDLMYTEFVHSHIHLNDLTSCEQSKGFSKELKKYLFDLCYQKFCELWLHKTANISLLSTKQLKRFISTLLRHTRSGTSISNMNLKKLILYNGGLTGYPKKPHLILCINIITSVFTTLLRNSSEMLLTEKKANSNSFNNIDTKSIKLYHQGTTKIKGFLEIVNEYKLITKTNRLSFYEVADIQHAYEGILQPGQYIDQMDLDTCAYENYRLKKNYDISSEDLNDDFDFSDVESIPAESVSKLMFNVPPLNNYFKADKFQEHTLECEVQSRSYFGLKYDKKYRSIEAIETSSMLVLYNIPTPKIDNYFFKADILYLEHTFGCVAKVQVWFGIKKNSLNEDICMSMVNILKADDFIHQSWKECNNSHKFISKLLKAGVTLPIEESNTGHSSKCVEVCAKWFCKEYLQDDKFYELAVSIIKNICLYIDEELQIEPNINVQTDQIDTNNVDMSLVPSNISTSNVFNIVNNVTIQNEVTSDPQSTNDDPNDEFLQNLMNENSNNSLENIDDNDLYNVPVVSLMDINDPDYCISMMHEFDEERPFGYDNSLVSKLSLDSNTELEDEKKTEDYCLTTHDQFVGNAEMEEESFLDCIKSMEEVSMMPTDKIVHFDKKDEIRNGVHKSVVVICGFDNAGLLKNPD